MWGDQIPNRPNSAYTSGPQSQDKSTGSGLGLATAISGISTILGGIADVRQFKQQLESETNAIVQNIGNAVTAFEYEHNAYNEQIDNINEALHDKMSEAGLIAIQNEATLRAAAAETGTTGGTTDNVIRDAYIKEAMDKANIRAAAKQQTSSVLRMQSSASLKLKHDIQGIASRGTSVSIDPTVSVLAGGLSGMQNLYSMLPNSYRAQLWEGE